MSRIDRLRESTTWGIDKRIGLRDRGGMAKPTSDKSALPSTPFLSSYHELFNSDDLWAAARQCGAVERARKMDVPALVEATVLAMSSLPGTQTTAFANYIQLTGESVAPSAFYDRFNEGFANLMADVSRRAIAAVRAVAPEDDEGRELSGLLEHFKDVQATDSTCQLLKRFAEHWAPSTSPDRPASFKLHAIVSLKDGLPIEQHLSAQRDHDSPQLADEHLLPGTLFLADLGYVDHGRTIRLKRRGVHLVMRLKKDQNPRIHRVRTGQGSKLACRGMPLRDALASGALDFHRGRLDIDVILTAKINGEVVEEKFRVVGLARDNAEDDWYYLTTIPDDVLAVDQVSLAYTLRWDIGASCKGRMNQSVKVRPGSIDSRPRSLGGAVARKQDGEALRQQTSKGGCATLQVAANANADVASLHANPVAETVDNARRQQVPYKTSPMRRHPPAGYQRRHGAKVHAETGETLGVRRRNLAEKARPITVSGKWEGRHQGVGSGHSTVDPRAAKRAGREGPGPVGSPFGKVRQG